MTQKRDLHPVTTYLPQELIEWLEARGAATYDPVSAVIRKLLLQQSGLDHRRSRLPRDRTKS